MRLITAFIYLFVVTSLVGCYPEKKHSPDHSALLNLPGYDANTDNPPPNPLPPETKLWVGDSYVALGAWASWFPGSVNAGVGGVTVGMVLDRVQAMPTVPPTVFVWCGINDLNIAVPRGATIEQYGQLLDSLTAKGATRIICLSPLPVGKVLLEISPSPATPDVVDLLNQQEQAIAAQRGAQWIDLRSAVVEADGWCDPQYIMPNGIHLNALGYSRVVALLEYPNSSVIASENPLTAKTPHQPTG